MNEQDGWAVEVYADAPMRTRAWFENADEAHEYAARFGGQKCTRIYASAMVAGDMDALRADAADNRWQIAQLMREIDDEHNAAEESRQDAADARAELAALRKEAA